MQDDNNTLNRRDASITSCCASPEQALELPDLGYGSAGTVCDPRSLWRRPPDMVMECRPIQRCPKWRSFKATILHCWPGRQSKN
jgi:hypothetical protein